MSAAFHADLAASIANTEALIAQAPEICRDPLQVALKAQREALQRLEEADEQLLEDGEELLEDDIARVASALSTKSEATDMIRVTAMADSFTQEFDAVPSSTVWPVLLEVLGLTRWEVADLQFGDTPVLMEDTFQDHDMEDGARLHVSLAPRHPLMPGTKSSYLGYEREGYGCTDPDSPVSDYILVVEVEAESYADDSERATVMVSGCLRWYKMSSRWGNRSGIHSWQPEFVTGSYDVEEQQLILQGQEEGLGAGLAAAGYDLRLVVNTGGDMLICETPQQIIMTKHLDVHAGTKEETTLRMDCAVEQLKRAYYTDRAQLWRRAAGEMPPFYESLNCDWRSNPPIPQWHSEDEDEDDYVRPEMRGFA